MRNRRFGRVRVRGGWAVVLAVATCAAVSSAGLPAASAAPVQATKLYLDLGRVAGFGQAVGGQRGHRADRGTKGRHHGEQGRLGHRDSRGAGRTGGCGVRRGLRLLPVGHNLVRARRSRPVRWWARRSVRVGGGDRPGQRRRDRSSSRHRRRPGRRRRLRRCPSRDELGRAGRTHTSWTERERLIAPDTPGQVHYGSALALDGSTLLVGPPWDHSGTAYAYWR